MKNIIGFFNQPFYGKFPFKGNFNQDNQGNIQGKMEDILGKSVFKGNLDLQLGIIEFNKQYNSKNDVFSYKFENKNGLWVGNFYLNERLSGEAFCEIYQNKPKFDWNDIFRSSELSLDFLENWSKGVTKDLVDWLIGVS